MSSFLDVANGLPMFILCSIVILAVVIQAIIFMKKAWNMGISIGMNKKDLKKVMYSSITFSVLPSVSILIMLLILMRSLGSYFPWLRLSVVGSGVYENLAAGITATSFGLEGIADSKMDLSIFVSIMWVMTFGIISGPIVSAFGTKSIHKGIDNLKNKNETVFNVVFSTLFVTLLSVFAAPYLAAPFKIVDNKISIVIPFIVFIVGGIISVSINVLSKKLDSKLLREFAFPLSLVIGMLSAVLFGKVLV